MSLDDEIEDQLAHWITVADLRTLLADPRLHADDVLWPNAVKNLAVVRGGVYIGFVDLLHGCQGLELSDHEEDPS